LPSALIFSLTEASHFLTQARACLQSDAPKSVDELLAHISNLSKNNRKRGEYTLQGILDLEIQCTNVPKLEVLLDLDAEIKYTFKNQLIEINALQQQIQDLTPIHEKSPTTPKDIQPLRPPSISFFERLPHSKKNLEGHGNVSPVKRKPRIFL